MTDIPKELIRQMAEAAKRVMLKELAEEYVIKAAMQGYAEEPVDGDHRGRTEAALRAVVKALEGEQV